MQTILIGFAARSLTRDLADHDAHLLRDIGVTRATDGTLRLLDDPAVPVTTPAKRLKPAFAPAVWARSLRCFLRPSRGLKTAL
jgi:hypothetical protein